MTPAACRVTLREWESRRPEPGSGLEGRSLGGEAERALAQRLARAGMLEVTELRVGLMVGSFSHVGRVRLGGVEITVQPKLDHASLLSLLRYAYGFRRLKLLHESEHRLDSTGFADLLVSQLLAEVSELVARGLHRAYVPRDEWLSMPRGRIDLRRIAARGGVIDAALPCTHHPRIEDTLINRAILAGLGLASSMAGDHGLRRESRRLASLLGEGVTATSLYGDLLDRAELGVTRLTASYQPPLTLIRLLRDAQGVSLTGDDTSSTLPGFLFDMNRFFQALLSRFLAENLPDHRFREEHRLRGLIAYVPAYNPRNRQASRLRPDFVITSPTGTTAILDAKYRDLWERPLPREMLYQLALYAMSHEGAASTILYPTMQPQAREARIEVREPVHGGRRAIVIVKPVDLAYLERLTTGRTTPSMIRERRAYAIRLAFGESAGSA